MEIKIKQGCKTTIIKGKTAENFKRWLDHECDGAEPTQELLDEFLELEAEFGLYSL